METKITNQDASIATTEPYAQMVAERIAALTAAERDSLASQVTALNCANLIQSKMTDKQAKEAYAWTLAAFDSRIQYGARITRKDIVILLLKGMEYALTR